MDRFNEIYNKFVLEFSDIFYNIIRNNNFSDYVFLCIGSDRIIGDAFGPLVGYNLNKLLKNSYYNNIKIIGTLEDTVCYMNVIDKINSIYNENKETCIIAIDAALSKKEDIGKIIVSDKKLQLGIGMGKRKIEVGDMNIKGIVAKNTNIVSHNFRMLQNAPLNLVVKLAEITSNGIYDSINNFQNNIAI